MTEEMSASMTDEMLVMPFQARIVTVKWPVTRLFRKVNTLIRERDFRLARRGVNEQRDEQENDASIESLILNRTYVPRDKKDTKTWISYQRLIKKPCSEIKSGLAWHNYGDFNPEEVSWCDGIGYVSDSTLADKLSNPYYGLEMVKTRLGYLPEGIRFDLLSIEHGQRFVFETFYEDKNKKLPIDLLAYLQMNMVQGSLFSLQQSILLSDLGEAVNDLTSLLDYRPPKE